MPEYIPLTDGTEESEAQPQYIPTEGLAPAVPVAPEVADARARKVNFGLADRSPGVDALRSEISSGQEDRLRNRLAIEENLDWQKRKLDLIQTIGASEHGPLNPDQQNFIMGLAKGKPIDPQTIIEELYARRLVDTSVAQGGDDNTVFRRGIQENTSGTLQDMDIAKGLITKKETAATILHELEERHSRLPFVNNPFSTDSGDQPTKLGSFLKGLVPFLREYELHNAVTDKGNAFMPGGNMADQVQNLWLQPASEFNRLLREKTEELWKKDPGAALKLANAAVHYSTSNAVVDTAMAVGEVAGFIPPSVYGKVLGKAIPKLKEIGVTKPADAVAAKVAEAAPKEPSPSVLEQPKQLEMDLFPDNGQLEMFGQREQTKPGLPPGQLRGTYVPESQVYPGNKPYRDLNTGRMVRSLDNQTQGELNLQGGSSQGGFDFGGTGGLPRAPEGSFIGKPAPAPEPEVASQVKQALKDVIQSQEGTSPEPDLAKTLEGMGDTQRAGIVRAFEYMNNQLLKHDPTKDLETLMQQMPSIFQPFNFFRNGTSLSREYAGRAALEAMQYASKFIDRAADGTQVVRLTPEALARAVEQTTNILKQKYTHLGDAVLDIRENPKNVLTNTHSVSIHLGKPDGTLFPSKENAQFFATEKYKLTPGQADVVPSQKGTGFYLDIRKDINEADSSVRDLLLNTQNETPRSVPNTFLGYVRSAASLVSDFQQANRNVATHAPQELRALMIDMAKDIGKLSKAERKEIGRLLDANAQEVDSVGVRGKYYDSVADLEIAYKNINGHMPSPEAVKVYHRYVQLNDMDMALREFGWLRDMSRAGAENFRFTGVNGEKTPFFKGVERTDFIKDNSQNAGIVYFDPVSKSYHFMYKHDMKDDPIGKSMLEKIRDGQARIVQIFESQKRPLRDTTGIKEEINFVVTDNFDSKRIRFGESGEYTPGSHKIYQHPWFVKQPVIETGRKGVLSYFGDRTIMNASSEAEAKKLAEKFTEGARLLKAGDNEALDKFVQSNFEIGTNEFKQLFTPAGPGGGLSVEHPIVYTYTGRDTFESSNVLREGGYRELYDRTRSSYDLSQTMDKRFLAERDQTISSALPKGSTGNPLLQFVPAKVLDPWSALQKGLANSVRGRWMNDYKIAAAESWVSEFKDVFQQSKIAAAERNPVYFLYHPEELLNEATAATKGDVLAAARNAQRSAVNFIGMQSDLGGRVTWLESKLMNGIYNKAGKSWADYASENFLPAIRDPSVYLRAVGFHTQLGFFNPVQMFVQANTLVHVNAVAGATNGVPGTFAGVLAKSLRYTEDPAIIARYAKAAEKVGWNRDDFIEAYTAYRNSGIGRVGGETAWRDDIFDPKLFKSATGTFLDKGAMFFNAGESLVRDAAYFTAYREWRRANIGKTLTDRAQADIVNRANTLSLDMTRASNAAWQSGIFAPATQFMTYNTRLMEQFLGKRLTTTEKARALGTYAALFGIPIAASAPTGFADLYSDMRTSALMKGINMDDAAVEAFHGGLTSLATHFITGTQMNVSERYGPGANKTIEQILHGDKDFLEIIAGPSGKILTDMFKTTLPFITHLGKTLSGQQEDFPLRPDDWLDVAKNLAVVNNFTKAYYAWNYHSYWTKNEGLVDDSVTKTEGLLMGLLGLTPVRENDAFLLNGGLKDLKKVQDQAALDAQKEYHRAFRDAANNDYNSMNDSLARAKTYMEGVGMDAQQKAQVFSRASTGYEPLITTVNRRLLEHSDIRERPDLIRKKFGIQ